MLSSSGQVIEWTKWPGDRVFLIRRSGGDAVVVRHAHAVNPRVGRLPILSGEKRYGRNPGTMFEDTGAAQQRPFAHTTNHQHQNHQLHLLRVKNPRHEGTNGCSPSQQEG